MPENLVDYYEPIPAPDWVDPDKLKMASKLWTENTMSSLAMLYSASLPACYLLKRGITALYQSQKLRDSKYIFQRIYETGLFLEAVMDPGGLQVVEDIHLHYEKLVVETLNALDKDGKWTQDGHQIRSTGRVSAPIDPQRFRARFEQAQGKPQRFIWGKGYITTKKVRFLHASMRYMLTHPDRIQAFGDRENPQSLSEALSQRQTPWDFEENGEPINQEDLAYTLLTFGLLIPDGLEKFGIHSSHEEKQAFLHMWKLVGHILGIKPELLTDNLDEAWELFRLVQTRQAESSEDGIVLTEALMGFLGDYLPNLPGLADRLSARLMIHQLGEEQASKILTKELLRSATRFWRKLIYGFCALLIRIYFTLFSRFLTKTETRMHQVSEEIIQSWRGAFVRRPFFVPVNATTWLRQAGVDPAFSDQLRAWRLRLFRTLAVGLVFLVISTLGIAAILPALFFYGRPGMWISIAIAVAAGILNNVMLDWALPALFKKRPQPAVS